MIARADGAEGDHFGGSVAISGGTAIVGASGDDDCGGASGSVYVFQDTGRGSTQVAKLTASDGAMADYFGTSLAISGNTAVVGASGDNDCGSESGSVYIFQDTPSRWTQVAKLAASDGAAGDRFGYCVAISGNTAIVGAWGDDDVCPGNIECDSAGSAYLFDATTGEELFKLTASDAAEDDRFGGYVAIDGNTAVVARDWSWVTDRPGSVYVFTFPFPIPVDFNDDGLCNDEDVDILRDAINSASSDPKFDVNGDSILNDDDFNHMILVNIATELGDSNLDWNVDAQDLANVRMNFGSSAGWASGNSNLDDTVDAADLAFVRTNFGFNNPFVSAAPLAPPTPEPATIGMLATGLMLWRRSSALGHPR